MRANVKVQIGELLGQYRYFSECIILGIEWRDYGTTVDIEFQCMGNADTKAPGGVQRSNRFLVRFFLVQEFHIWNYLNDSMVERPDRINWGLNEIALARLDYDEELTRSYEHLPVSFHHISLLWEGDRRITVVCTAIEIIEL